MPREINNSAVLTRFSSQAEELLDEDDGEFGKHKEKKLEEGDEYDDESELDVGEAADLSPQNQKLVCLHTCLGIDNQVSARLHDPACRLQYATWGPSFFTITA